MSQPAVVAREKARLLDIAVGRIMYTESFLGRDCLIFYIFAPHGGLVSGIYRFHKESAAGCVDLFLDLRIELDQRYGKATRFQEHWLPQVRRHGFRDAAHIAETVAAGHLELEAEWDTAESFVFLACNRDPTTFHVSVWLTYSDPDYAKQQGAADYTRDLDTL